MNKTISVSIPFSLDNKNAIAMTENLQDTVRLHIRMLFLTNPGERIRDRKFGIGIRNYLFENQTHTLSEDIKYNINDQFKKYLPYVNINDVEVMTTDQENELYIKFSYSVSFLNVTEEYIFSV